jgi:hypothetical protein
MPPSTTYIHQRQFFRSHHGGSINSRPSSGSSVEDDQQMEPHLNHNSGTGDPSGVGATHLSSSECLVPSQEASAESSGDAVSETPSCLWNPVSIIQAGYNFIIGVVRGLLPSKPPTASQKAPNIIREASITIQEGSVDIEEGSDNSLDASDSSEEAPDPEAVALEALRRRSMPHTPRKSSNLAQPPMTPDNMSESSSGNISETSESELEAPEYSLNSPISSPSERQVVKLPQINALGPRQPSPGGAADYDMSTDRNISGLQGQLATTAEGQITQSVESKDIARSFNSSGGLRRGQTSDRSQRGFSNTQGRRQSPITPPSEDATSGGGGSMSIEHQTSPPPNTLRHKQSSNDLQDRYDNPSTDGDPVPYKTSSGFRSENSQPSHTPIGYRGREFGSGTPSQQRRYSDLESESYENTGLPTGLGRSQEALANNSRHLPSSDYLLGADPAASPPPTPRMAHRALPSVSDTHLESEGVGYSVPGGLETPESLMDPWRRQNLSTFNGPPTPPQYQSESDSENDQRSLSIEFQPSPYASNMALQSDAVGNSAGREQPDANTLLSVFFQGKSVCMSKTAFRASLSRASDVLESNSTSSAETTTSGETNLGGGNLTMTDAIGGSVQDTVAHQLVEYSTSWTAARSGSSSESIQYNGEGPSSPNGRGIGQSAPEAAQPDVDDSSDEMPPLTRIASYIHHRRERIDGDWCGPDY